MTPEEIRDWLYEEIYGGAYHQISKIGETGLMVYTGADTFSFEVIASDDEETHQ